MKGHKFSFIRDFILSVGFVDRSVAGQYHRFEYALPNTFVLFPPYKDDDIVASYNVANVRDLLYYRGLMSREDFDEALRESSVAS